METQNSSTPVGEEILNNEGNPQDVDNPNGDVNEEGQPQVVPNEQYKNLQSAYTRDRQELIATKVELAQANPKSISTIKDLSLQNAVVKQLYGVDTYAQLVAVYGETFYQSKDEEELDKTEKLEREVRLLKYQSQTNETEQAIEKYKIQNPQFFTSPENEAKLRDELKYISWELPLSERIRRAWAISFVPSIDPKTSAYQSIGFQPTGGNVATAQKAAQETEKQKQIEAWRILLGLK